MKEIQKTNKIKVFKLGGKFFTPNIIRSFFEQLPNDFKNDEILFVVSAVKEVTRLLRLVFITKTEIKINEDLKNSLIKLCLNKFKKIHIDIISELFKNNEDNGIALINFNNLFNDLEKTVNSYTDNTNVDIFYATILQFGELASSKILSVYMVSIGLDNKDFDARKYVVTSDNHRESNILKVENNFLKLFSTFPILVTQGFIGRTSSGLNSLVGFDGSDYSATQFANSLITNDEGIILTFWKDVDGVYTKNPTENSDAKLIRKLSRQEYIESVKQNKSFVVRPDSITSLNKDIKVNIRSYVDLSNKGTEII